MKRFVATLLILSLLAPSVLLAEPLKEYVPYEEGEFPLWTYKIRRAEQIFFGSMMITIPVAALVYTLAVNNDWVAQPTSEAQQYLVGAAIAEGLSLTVTVADSIIGAVRTP